MTDANAMPAGRGFMVRMLGVVALGGIVLGLATLGTCGWNRNSTLIDKVENPPTKPEEEPKIDGRALFADWPKQKPDAVIILTGQTFGFLQPCGCSRPQLGGLERRAVFLDSLKAKGWPIVGFDLGDLYPQKSAIDDQAKMKYKLTMNALRDMGYIAVGIGESDFAAGLDKLHGEYALQKDQPPYMLAGNLLGVSNGKPQPRDDRFPTPHKNRSLIGLAEVATVNNLQIGAVGIVGKSLAAKVTKLDNSIDFADNGVILKDAVDGPHGLTKLKTAANVLLYQGTSEEAQKLAAAWPQFQIIVCQADDPEPPQFPQQVNGGRTLIIQVGHKGRYVGVVGLFKKPGGFDMKYQLVPMTEYYITGGTEEEARKANAVLPLLEQYSESVRDRKFLERMPKAPHQHQIQEPKLNLSYVGSQKCQNCHAAQFAKWNGTPHAKALDALEKIAKRPSLRNFDGECVQCHVVGLHYNTGYVNQAKTPELAHVGCENCHGPGSGHMTNPKDANLQLLQLKPWALKAGDRLPSLETIKKIGALPSIERGKIPLQPQESRIINAVSSMCAKCHDHENDPNFDFFTYWPKVFHTFPKAAPEENPDSEKK